MSELQYRDQPKINHVLSKVLAGMFWKLKADTHVYDILLQGCWQICLKATPQEPTNAIPFLKDGCALLRSAFAFDSLLLKPVPRNGPPNGPTLIW